MPKLFLREKFSHFMCFIGITISEKKTRSLLTSTTSMFPKFFCSVSWCVVTLTYFLYYLYMNAKRTNFSVINFTLIIRFSKWRCSLNRGLSEKNYFSEVFRQSWHARFCFEVKSSSIALRLFYLWALSHNMKSLSRQGRACRAGVWLWKSAVRASTWSQENKLFSRTFIEFWNSSYFKTRVWHFFRAYKVAPLLLKVLVPRQTLNMKV
jgi:hypothetical protein